MTITPENVQAEYERVRLLDDSALDAELSTIITATAENIAKIAAIIRAKEERGHDISAIRVGMVQYLRLVSEGKLIPEAVATFGHRKQILRRLASVPVHHQKSICAGTTPVPREWTHQNHNRSGSHLPRTGQVIVDQEKNAIIVTGVDVVITAKELAYYQSQLVAANRLKMCSGCGETVGVEPPERCPKCGSRAFEQASSLLVA